MTRRISEDDKKLLIEFVAAREKFKKRKTKNNIANYESLRELCCKTFDHIVEGRAGKYKQFSNYEDLKQDGRLALLAALNSFYPDKGSFMFWANRYIKTRLSRQANKHSVLKIPLKKARNIQPFKVSKMPEESYVPDIGGDLDKEYWKTQIHNILSTLPKDQKIAAEVLFYTENSIKNSKTLICNELKISLDECISLINLTKERLKNELTKYITV